MTSCVFHRHIRQAIRPREPRDGMEQKLQPDLRPPHSQQPVPPWDTSLFERPADKSKLDRKGSAAPLAKPLFEKVSL